MPKKKPEIVTMPSMNYVAVRGEGDPNEPDGAYKKSIGILYAAAYTIKMSKMGKHRMEGYFDFVVPPLEGFWKQEGVEGIDYSNKSAFQWISASRILLPWRNWNGQKRRHPGKRRWIVPRRSFTQWKKVCACR